MYEEIKARYEKGYIRDDQLDRYVELDVIPGGGATII